MMPSVSGPAAAPVHAAIAPSRSSAAHTVVAWLSLVVMDVVLRVGDVRRVIDVLTFVAPRRPLSGEPARQRAHAICAAMDSARVLYPRHVRCLQSAAAAGVLLRLMNVNAEMVIGVRRVPFAAHAWVELEGEIVMNDRPRLSQLYTVIERC